MYSNEQVANSVVEYMKEIQQYINIMEKEVVKETPNLSIIASALGKLSKVYTMICDFTGIWGGPDFRVGGFRESVWAVQGAKSGDSQD